MKYLTKEEREILEATVKPSLYLRPTRKDVLSLLATIDALRAENENLSTNLKECRARLLEMEAEIYRQSYLLAENSNKQKYMDEHTHEVYWKVSKAAAEENASLLEEIRCLRKVFRLRTQLQEILIEADEIAKQRGGK